MFEQKKIDISLPTSYNRCSLAQLREIAAVILTLHSSPSVSHAYSIQDVKHASFFALANLDIVEPVNLNIAVDEQCVSVRFKRKTLQRVKDTILKSNIPFTIYIWQVNAWLERRKNRSGRTIPGMLDWMDSDWRDPFVVFPFEYIRRAKGGVFGFFCPKSFKGPNPLLDGFSWQRYRFAQDYMKNYIEQANYLERLRKVGKRASEKDLLKAIRNVDTAKALFLANLFEAKVSFTDEQTGLVCHDWHYLPNQISINAEYFRAFPDVDWQIVLLWWSGIMQSLGRTYPRVIKVQPTKNEKNDNLNPIELYARTTATIEKYVGMNAEDVEREPYTTILQQMEDMARSNEEMDRIKVRH